MTVLQPQERNLVADQVYDAILDAIMSGEIPVGSRLRIRNLAEALGTSPMPVRDSITRLEQTGLVQRVAHKGAIVAHLTPEELVSTYDTRLILEREATRLGSQRLTASQGTRMRRELELMNKALAVGKKALALDHDEAMLTILYGASGNDVLVDLIRALWQRCRAYKLFGIEGATGVTPFEIWSVQEPLIEAALAHDSRGAVTIIEKSLVDATARIRLMLDAS